MILKSELKSIVILQIKLLFEEAVGRLKNKNYYCEVVLFPSALNFK
jgi:hypothetical protein